MAMTTQQINELYTKHYIDLLKQNLSEQTLNIISLKASVKVGEEAYQELQKSTQALLEEKEKEYSDDDTKKEIEQLKINNDLLQRQINEMHPAQVNYNKLNSEYHALKSQVIEKEKTIGELRLQLEQTTAPDNKKSKAKKAVELNLPPPKIASIETITEDGGSF
jgi:hypothetical protein